MIKVERNITIPKINKLYTELYLTGTKDIDLYLPKKIEKLEFGVLFSYLQFLATWIRNKRSGKLHLPVNNVEEAVNYLNDNEFVYPSIVIAWEKEIIDTEGRNLKSVLKEPSKRYFEKMDFFELKGMTVPLFCFDHDKSNRGLSKHFYNKRDLASEDSLSFNLFRAFQKVCGQNYTVTRNSIKKNYDSFLAIIHELFANTHEHAKTNELGYNLYPNIRATHLKFHKKPVEKLIKLYSNNRGLVNYFNSGFKVNEQGELYLIEISILDSGPGLVKRYKGLSDYNISINEEIEMIKECLYRHNTSAEGLQGDVKGMGLDRVLKTIDGKGFVRIKSGRADVFRDMKTQRYVHHNRASDIQLKDWLKDSAKEFTALPPAEGTLISIFYPLSYEQ